MNRPKPPWTKARFSESSVADSSRLLAAANRLRRSASKAFKRAYRGTKSGFVRKEGSGSNPSFYNQTAIPSTSEFSEHDSFSSTGSQIGSAAEYLERDHFATHILTPSDGLVCGHYVPVRRTTTTTTTTNDIEEHNGQRLRRRTTTKISKTRTRLFPVRIQATTQTAEASDIAARVEAACSLDINGEPASCISSEGKDPENERNLDSTSEGRDEVLFQHDVSSRPAESSTTQYTDEEDIVTYTDCGTQTDSEAVLEAENPSSMENPSGTDQPLSMNNPLSTEKLSSTDDPFVTGKRSSTGQDSSESLSEEFYEPSSEELYEPLFAPHRRNRQFFQRPIARTQSSKSNTIDLTPINEGQKEISNPKPSPTKSDSWYLHLHSSPAPNPPSSSPYYNTHLAHDQPKWGTIGLIQPPTILHQLAHLPHTAFPNPFSSSQLTFRKTAHGSFHICWIVNHDSQDGLFKSVTRINHRAQRHRWSAPNAWM
ncbi:hypothetical protein BT63DRAFT_283586 [Microthyrium microscopicum]|uniref:Uncharacterized protein n=1 Tax=Microthyrium microscopicum TaxID=703497 RepID=A0A6A6UBK1_9PEZI|nr:hypothetical protein BT63DRAFT_283586 [Microthyrium microscopicum]